MRPTQQAHTDREMAMRHTRSTNLRRRFAGCSMFFLEKPRKNSVSSWLRKLSKQFQVAVEVEMVDIQVRPYHDLTSAKVQQNLLSKIASGRYFAMLF